MAAHAIDQPREQPLAQRAETALKDAVDKVAQEARRSGTTVVVWQQGAVVEIPADQLPAPVAPAK
jgi:hypothetical protein